MVWQGNYDHPAWRLLFLFWIAFNRDYQWIGIAAWNWIHLDKYIVFYIAVWMIRQWVFYRIYETWNFSVSFYSTFNVSGILWNHAGITTTSQNLSYARMIWMYKKSFKLFFPPPFRPNGHQLSCKTDKILC